MDKNVQNGELSLAMAYVPNQKFRDIYDMETALMKGTIFKELDKPFLGYMNVPLDCKRKMPAMNMNVQENYENKKWGIDRGGRLRTNVGGNVRGFENYPGGNYGRYDEEMSERGGRRK